MYILVPVIRTRFVLGKIWFAVSVLLVVPSWWSSGGDDNVSLECGTENFLNKKDFHKLLPQSAS